MGSENKMITKERGINISLSALGAMIPIFAAMWFLVKPLVSDAVAEELKDTIREVVKEEVQPLGEGFRVLLVRDIAALRLQIARVSAREQAARLNPEVSWTQADAAELEGLRIELEGLQSALRAMTPAVE